ncbi:MAG: hypothetical protein H7301_15420 [Cryobacterium sp.]|nr:hypothetical protein [Oligoflexia bacterium]
MFKLIGWIGNAILFSAVVLIAAHFIRWNGHSVSDQVTSTLSSAERSAPARTVKKKSAELLEDARAAAENALRTKKESSIAPEDKEELRALISTRSDRG